MKTLQFKVSVTMPDNDYADARYLQFLLQSDFDMEDEDRWKVEVEEIKPKEEIK